MAPATIVRALEAGLLVTFALLPLALADFWVIFVTRVLILALLALSFDLVWGFAGIMSFGQALFFGSAGYGVALLARDAEIRSIFVVLPAAVVIGLVLSSLVAAFLLLGRNPPSLTFVALGTLTGSYAADRLARGWYYLGGQNGIPSRAGRSTTSRSSSSSRCTRRAASSSDLSSASRSRGSASTRRGWRSLAIGSSG